MQHFQLPSAIPNSPTFSRFDCLGSFSPGARIPRAAVVSIYRYIATRISYNKEWSRALVRWCAIALLSRSRGGFLFFALVEISHNVGSRVGERSPCGTSSPRFDTWQAFLIIFHRGQFIYWARVFAPRSRPAPVLEDTSSRHPRENLFENNALASGEGTLCISAAHPIAHLNPLAGKKPFADHVRDQGQPHKKAKSRKDPTRKGHSPRRILHEPAEDAHGREEKNLIQHWADHNSTEGYGIVSTPRTGDPRGRIKNI